MADNLDESLKTIAFGGSVIFFGLFFGIIFGVINQIILGRFLGVDNYGLFYLSYTIITVILPFSTLDLSSSLSRFLPYHFSRGEKNLVKSAIRFSEILVLILSILFFILIYFLSEMISVNIFHDINLTPVLRYFAIGIPLFSISGILEGIIRSFKGAKYKVAIFDISNWIIRISFFIPFIILGYALFGAILSCLIALLFTIFASIFVINKKLFSDHARYQIIPIGKKLMIFSWPITLASIIYLIVSKTDVLFLGYFFDSTSIGIYMPSLIIAQYVTMFSVPFIYMFLPVISGLIGQKQFDIVETLFKSTSKWIFLIILPVAIYILLFPRESLSFLYGPEFSSGYLSLIILTSGLTLSVFSGMAAGILVGGGHTKLNLAVEIFSAIINIIFALVMIPLYGIIGAAVAVVATFLTRNIVSLCFVYRVSKIHPFNKSYGGIVISGVTVFFIGFIIKTQLSAFFSSIILIALIGTIIFILYFILIIFLRCLDNNDRQIIGSLFNKIRLSFKRINNQKK